MALSKEKKEEILHLYGISKTKNQIAAEVGCSFNTVSRVINGATADDSKQYNIPKKIQDELECMYRRYGKNGTHRAKNRLRTGR